MNFSFTKLGITIPVVLAIIFIVLQSGVLGDTRFNITLKSNTDLDNGLVAHWTFDGKDITANDILDVSGSGFRGGFFGATTTAATTSASIVGRVGQAFQFDKEIAYQAPVRESTTVSEQDADSTTFAVSMPTTRPDGDLYIAQIAKDDGEGTFSTVPSGWTELVNADQGGETGVRFGVWYRVGSSEPASYTWGGDSEKWVGAVHRISGYSGVPIVASGQGTSANPTAPTITSLENNSLILRMFGADDIDTTASYWPVVDERIFQEANSASTGVTSAAAGQNQTHRGEMGAGTFTLSASEQWVAATLALEPSFATTTGLHGAARVETGDSHNVGDTDDLTLAGWFYRDGSSSDDVLIAKRNSIAVGDAGYIAYIASTTDKLRFEVSDGVDEYQLESTTTFTSSGWHHFAIVWDQDSAAGSEIYIDGAADSATKTGVIGDIGSLTNVVSLNIGAESDVDNGIQGKLDDMRIYNRVVTANEISRLHDLGGTARINIALPEPTFSRDNLLLHYTFDTSSFVPSNFSVFIPNPFFNDTFTDTGNTILSSHTPDTGDSWTRIYSTGGSSCANDPVLDIDSNQLTSQCVDTTTAGAAYSADATYPGADYQLQYTCVDCGSSDDYTYGFIRANETLSKGYVIWNMSDSSADDITFSRINSGSSCTQLDTVDEFSMSASLGNDNSDITMQAIGDEITAFINNVGYFHVSDSNITDPGKGGVGMGALPCDTGGDLPSDTTTQIIDNVSLHTIATSSTASRSPATNGEVSNTWTTPANAYADDGAHAESRVVGNAQDYGDFGFDGDIPAGSTIRGIQCKVEAESGSSDNWVELGFEVSNDNGATWSSQLLGRYLSSLPSDIYLFGHANYLWGLTWTAADLNDTDFRIRLESTAFRVAGSDSDLEVDYVSCKVFYDSSVGADFSGNTLGRIGQGREFDGVDDYETAGNIGTAKTIAFWMKTSTTTSSMKIINIDGTDQIELNASSAVTATSFPAATVYVDGSSASAVIPDTEWHHVAITDTTGVSASTFEVGRVGTNYFGGIIDDLRVYDRVLTASEINRIMDFGGTTRINVTASEPETTKGDLALHYSFDAESFVNPTSYATTTADTFTSSGSWTAPLGVSVIAVEAWGGGGGGGCDTFGSADGAGGGAFSKANDITVIPGQSYTVTVGSGGSGATVDCTGFGSNGSTGGSSGFADNSEVLAKGGGAGLQSGTGAGGAAASGVGDTKFSGGNGADNGSTPGGGGGGAGDAANGSNAVGSTGGAGGSSGGGKGGDGADFSAGQAGATIGGGGAASEDANGAVGARGEVRILHNKAQEPTTVLGRIGQGRNFDGVDDYIDSGNIGTAKTIAFWMKTSTTTSSMKIINIDGTDQIELNASSAVTATSFPAATVYVDGSSASATIPDREWHHVVVTDTTGVSASTFEVGRVGTNYFGGTIDDVRAYSRALTATEITRLYNLGN